MRCRSALTRIDAMRTGELPEREQAEVREHLTTCRSCDDSVHDVSRLADVVKLACAVALPRTLRESIQDRCADSLGQLDTTDGRVWVAFSEHGLRMIVRGGSEAAVREAYANRYARPLKSSELPEKLKKEVLAAIEGAGASEKLVDFEEMGELEAEVLHVLAKIPRGEVRTYAWVAQQVGRPKAVRAIGSICAKNVVPFVIPCHRVVPTSGGVGQYAFGTDVKRELLAREGVDVVQLESLAKRGVRLIGSKTTKIVCFPTCKDARRIREENRVPFRAADEALLKGFRPCRRCQPFAA
ncbi:MAG TPA: methylated-DNA--[protein]-cysteine S-methyltransferase [Thermoanaerobaculia bacterium]|nr:methylated-DNA--[protein]-cysteine S-methyltransferase [Thermoanaerobaculia bacterium]